MSDQQFLAEVLENPADDAPRLVYADWLEEQGDPRGEFIRLQIERSKQPVGSAESMRLRTREQELLKKHSRKWAGPVAKIAPNHVFSRGLVESVDLGLKRFLETSDDLFAAAPIRDVGLRQCNESRMRELAGNDHLSKLSSLRLRKCTVGPDVIEDVLDALRPGHLDTLAVTEGQFGLPLSEVLARCDVAPTLRALLLSMYLPSEMDVRRIVEATPRLELLDVSQVGMSTDDVMSIASTSLKHLRHLQLPGANQHRPDGDGNPRVVNGEAVDAILTASRNRIEWLSLLATDHATRLAGPIKPRLTRLGLPRNNLRRDDLTALTESRHLQGLKYLDLRFSRELGPGCLREFIKSSLFGGLDCLRLSFDRKLSRAAFESVVRAWKEQERPTGNLCLPQLNLSGGELKELRKLYGKRSFVDQNEGLWDERFAMALLMPGETSLDVLDAWKRATD